MQRRFSHRYVISVLVADRVGILRDICTAVTDLGANIDGVSQTVVAGYFTVILTASFAKDHGPDRVRDAILDRFARQEASVIVRPYQARAVARKPADRARFVVTLNGKDSPGILKTVTTFLASRAINIEDWFVQFNGGSVTHIGEIAVPERLDIKQVQDELRQTLARFGLTVSLQHENIFIATNDIGPIGSLLAGDRPHDSNE